MLLPRDPWSSAPPEPRTREQNWATLLFSWWCTAFAAVIILVRLNGRKVRSNVFFREDWIMMFALIPLFARMALVHVVLLYGTNNVQTIGQDFTAEQLQHRSIGAKMVLASRIFYALFIWTSKWTVSEFLKRITIHLWRRSYELTLQAIRIFLLVTFVAVVIATLAECQPFDHYWQVVPDPGPLCRQGFAQLITMGSADIITDILLVAFPIPIVLRSGQPWTRKLQLTALFSTSIALIIITAFRMPMVIANQGRQQYRTVWASIEVLASTFVSNFVIIGSFLRDKGTKRNKYKAGSVSDSIERSSTRRPTLIATRSMASDEDLFRSLGCRVPEHLKDPKDDAPRLAPPALAASESNIPYSEKQASAGALREAVEIEEDSDDSMRKPRIPSVLPPSPTSSSLDGKKNTSFFDVGGLLENGHAHYSPESRSQTSTTVLANSPDASPTLTYDFAAPPPPTHTRRGSRALLSDIGGLVTSNGNPSESTNSILDSFSRRPSQHQRNSSLSSPPPAHHVPPTGVPGLALERQDTEISLQDAGGLLSSESGHVPARRALQQDLGSFLLSDQEEFAASAAATQQRPSPRASDIRTNRTSPPPVRNFSRSRPDDLDLHDPGGLLRK